MTEAADAASSRKRLHAAAACIALAYLAIALWLLPDYGPTWDPVIAELPHGERILDYWETGDPGYLDVNAHEPRPLAREPHPEFAVGGFGLHQVVAPLSAILSALSCRLFWTELGWLPALEAHHLPSIVIVALFCYGVVLVLGRRFGLVAGIGAALLLVTAPRYFAHAFNNVKDVPESCLYTAAVFACFVAMRRQTKGSWALAGAATAFALAGKINALFVPWQALAVWLGCLLVPSVRRAGRVRIRPIWIAVAALAFAATYYAISPDLWEHPIDATAARFGEVFRVGNAFADVDAELSWQRLGDSISLHGVQHVLWTTPPLILLLALVGLARPSLRAEERIFLIVGLAVPIGRTLLPGMRNFDGVRHFLEFFPMTCIAAGIGLGWIAAVAAATVQRRGAPARLRHALVGVLVALAVAPSVVATWRTHPNGICYFNSIRGGLAGAQAARITEATDYWANSYWQALDWLNDNAAPDSRLVVPIAGFVARAGASVKLRPDVEYVPDDESPAFDRTTYVMYVTRGANDPFVRVVDRTLEPVHTIEVQGGTILELFRLDPGEPEDQQAYAVRAQRFTATAREAAQRLNAWVLAHPEHFGLLELLTQGLRTEHADEARARLRELLPRDEFDVATFDALVWHFGTK